MSNRTNIESFHDFAEKSRLFNFCLLVEGKELWVPRDALACHSDALETMLYDSRYKEAEGGKAKLPEKKFSDVLEWLRCIIVCPNKKTKPIDSWEAFDFAYKILYLHDPVPFYIYLLKRLVFSLH